MSEQAASAGRLRVLIAGGGVAALEAVLALAELAPARAEVIVVAPGEEFVYRPLSVNEPFAYGKAKRYPLSAILAGTGAELIDDELASVDPAAQQVHTKGERTISYDALLLGLGARITHRYTHALTIDDRNLDETLHGLIQDVEGGYVRRLAFVAPGRLAWPLPLYELAMMTAGRAFDMGIELEVSLITPEDAPLTIFGSAVSEAVQERLSKLAIRTITSVYAEIPAQGEIVLNPGERRLQVDRVVALPELYGPSVRGLPLGEHGFIHVDTFCRVPGAGPVYAAGDATDFPIKQGGIASQQADVAAQSIAALAGAAVTPEPFHPVLHGILLTDAAPLYIDAQITGGHGLASEVTEAPTWPPPGKIFARYLAPVLQAQDLRTDPRSA